MNLVGVKTQLYKTPQTIGDEEVWPLPLVTHVCLGKWKLGAGEL